MEFNVLERLVATTVSVLWGWPLVLYIMGAGILITGVLGFIQFRYFFESWRLLLKPSSGSGQADLTPFQAFLNALSASVGNGSIAGIATAVFSGGPGAGLWIFIFGLFSMSIRFAEVYLSMIFPASAGSSVLGGPMIY